MVEAEPTLWQRLWYTRLRDVVRGRFDASLDWRLVVAEANLPSELAEAVSQAVKRTRLWRREKVDVATELIAHFQDGLTAGRTPQQLIKSFGDPARAAQLIRRAKKRGRPILWHAWHYGWITFVSLGLLYIFYGIFLMTGRPVIKTDFLAIINERAVSVSEAERAWPVYRTALGQLLVNRHFPKWSENPELSPDDAAWPEAVAWLDSHGAAMQLVREAAQYKEFGFPVGASDSSFSREDRQVLFEIAPADDDSVPTNQDAWEDRLIVSTRLPQLTTMRSLARLLTIDTSRARSVGDGTTALADIRAMIGISGHCEETPFLVNTMVAYAIQKMAYSPIQDVLREHPQLWSDAQLIDLAHSVAAAEIDWRRGFEGERASFSDILQRVYTDDGNGDGLPVFSGFGLFRMLHAMSSQPNQPTKTDWMEDGALVVLAAPTATFLVASRKEMAEVYNHYLDQSMQQIERPLWESGNDPEAELNAKLKGKPLNELHYCVVAMLAPGLESVRLSIATRNGQRDGVLIGLALELYHREHKSWPTTLDELSPRWLPEVPIDRITGQPLGYKVVNDRPVVYSVGVDRDDDGGRLPSDRDEHDKLDSTRASPMHFQPTPVTDWSHDGDWVIWSTGKIVGKGVVGVEMGAQND